MRPLTGSPLKKHKTTSNKSEDLNTSTDTDDTDFDRIFIEKLINFNNNEIFLGVEESQKIFERNYYLKPEEEEVFSSRIEGIQNQIDAFQYLCTQEKENKFLENVQKILGNTKDVTDIKELIEKIKESVLKRENFNTFLTILQKLVLIPQTNNGDKIWAKVQRYLENLIVLHEEEEGENHEEASANTNTVEELEGILAVRDKEMKKV